jgi:hypothetical protein
VFESPLSIEGRYAVNENSVIRLAEPGTFVDELTDVLRIGARKLLTQAVETEVADFIGRHCGLVTLIDVELSIRGILRGFGLKIGHVTRRVFEARIQELVCGPRDARLSTSSWARKRCG